MTGLRKEYLLNPKDLSNIHYTGEHLFNIIEEVINKVEAKKFVAIVLNNSSNITAVYEVKYIVRYANILTKYFKNSTFGSSWFNKVIKSKNIEGKDFIFILLIISSKSDIYNEDEDEEEYEELNIEKKSINEMLNIEQVIDLKS
ncbi:hypothetical protein C1646_761494 [Rhizophagus diaphanus]|nr:hypothetical protein C1646_761494 [Rhizophagus diaphanus] [Rhizophagus sp. MUCL 43196]